MKRAKACSITSQFITSDELLADVDPGHFIEMEGIDGIQIGTCSFVDTRNVQATERTSGIMSHETKTKVFHSSTFTGLYYGIKAYAHGPGKYITVENNIFDDNLRGVYISGMSNAEITGNNFSINSPYSSFNGGYGLYLDHSTAYKVEDNNFYHDGENAIGLGLVVNESGGDPNIIYRNYFLRLECGMDLQGENRSKYGDGLVLKCNQYDGTLMDKLITYDGPQMNEEAGVAESQGSYDPATQNPEDMAGNLFQNDGPSNGDFDDILNEGNSIVYYLPTEWEDIRVRPVDFTENVHLVFEVVSPSVWSFSIGCPPSEEPGGGGIGVIKGKMANADQKVDSTENLLFILIDGGNTEETQTDVDNSIPPETMQVYNELMSKSPYLSDTVVSTAIEKEDVLPGAMIRDIMVANPKAAKSEKLMEKLDERWDPLPDYMKGQILAGRSVVSIREETESRLAAFKLEKTKCFNDLTRYYLNDTINPVASMDSLMALLQTENSLSAKYSLAFLRGELGALGVGLVVLNGIPVQFELSARETAEHSQLLAYYNLLSGLVQEGKSILQADSSQMETLFDIEEALSGKASVYARNVLLALNQMEYEEPILLPDMMKSSTAIEEYNYLLGKANDAPAYIKVKPNPAKDYIIIEYELEKEIVSNIEIHDISGNLKYSSNFTNRQDRFAVDTRNWKAGVYIVTFKSNGKLIESVKFTVID